MQDGLNIRKLDLKTEIHPTAVVHPWAKIGIGVKIGPYSVIGENVEIGDRCVIGSSVLIDGRTKIGEGARFFHGASIGTEPQDISYNGEITFLEIGSNSTFREFTTANVATTPGESTRIGSNCYLMASSHVSHDSVLGDGVILANGVLMGGFSHIGDHATVGGGAIMHQFTRIGKYAFAGGGSRIERDIPPFIKAAGSPLRVYGVNTIGLERKGFSVEKRASIKGMFNLLYRNDLNVTQVVERLRNGDFEDPERKVFLEFLEASERGIAK